MLCEMQSVSSRIWTHVAVSILDYDNHYTTGTSNINRRYRQNVCGTKQIFANEKESRFCLIGTASFG